jgi:hypothetical protein
MYKLMDLASSAANNTPFPRRSTEFLVTKPFPLRETPKNPLPRGSSAVKILRFLKHMRILAVSRYLKANTDPWPASVSLVLFRVAVVEFGIAGVFSARLPLVQASLAGFWDSLH